MGSVADQVRLPDGRWQLQKPANRVAGNTLRRSGQLVVRHRAEHRFEDDLELESCERGPEAMVDAIAKREVPPAGTLDVEDVGLVEMALVPGRGSIEQDHRAVSRDLDPMQVDIAGRCPLEVLLRRVE